MDQLAPVGKVQRQDEAIDVASRQLKDAGVAFNDDRAPVGLSADMLDAGNRVGGEVSNGCLPVERAVGGQPQCEAAVGHEPVASASPLAQLAGRRPKQLPARPVELAHASEPGRGRDFEHAEVAVVEQPACEVRPRRAGQSVWGHPEMADEKAAQVPTRYAETGAQFALGRAVECAREDHPHRSTDELGVAGPRYVRLEPVGATAQAGAVAGGLGGRRQREAADVVRVWPSRAPRAAVDARGDDRSDRLHAVTHSGLSTVPSAGFGHTPKLDPVRKRRACRPVLCDTATVNSEFATTTDDTEALTALNRRFIEAFRQGSWELLEPILSPDFSYLDGHTGEVWTHERYVEDLRAHPSSALAIDQVVVHIDGDTAVVSARTSREGGRHGRYVDTYARREGSWLCVHACVWPLPG